MNRVVIGLGSNIDPKKNIELAIQEIGRRYHLLATSQIVETKPIGYVDQSNFLNGAVLIETKMDYDALKNHLQGLERDLGRVREENKYGPRAIDLDVVVWNGEVMDSDVYERKFLRQSIGEVWPDLNI